MRIVCVTHAYPRFDGDVAGAFVERLVLALARRGHTLAVVAPADQGRGGREVRHGVIVERVRYAPARWETLAYRGTMAHAVRSPLRLAAFAGLVLRLARRAAAVARQMPADLVHAHWWVPGGLSAWLVRRFGGPPYAVTLHGTDVALLERSRAGRIPARLVLAGAGAVTAVSSFLADRAASLAGVGRERITVCPMPADTARFGGARRGGAGMITLGRLTTQKRLDVLLGAVARLREAGRPLPLTVLGDGPARPDLERRAAELGVADLVRFAGEIEPPRVPDLLRDADVFAFPAVHEGFGLAAAEALMLGVPVVAAADGGGVSDVVPPTGGGRLVAADPDAFARAITDLLADPGAPERAARAGAMLRERLAPDAVARVMEGVLARVA